METIGVIAVIAAGLYLRYRKCDKFVFREIFMSFMMGFLICVNAIDMHDNLLSLFTVGLQYVSFCIYVIFGWRFTKDDKFIIFTAPIVLSGVYFIFNKLFGVEAGFIPILFGVCCIIEHDPPKYLKADGKK